MNITQDYIPAGRKNRPAKSNPCLYITIHNTGNTGTGSGAKNHANYLKGDAAANAPVSWHYTVDDTTIYQHLPDNETAYHAGDGAGPGNTQSIGIEICMNSDGDILKATDNAVWLTASLCQKHSIPIENVVQHNKWTGKNCPQMIRAGKPYSWDIFIGKIKDILCATPAPAPTPIMGAANIGAAAMAAFLLKTNASPLISCTPEELAGYYINEGKTEGVRGDIAFCQAIKETGWFRFGGDVLPEQNNFCGLGATNTTTAGKSASFGLPLFGTRAHIQHLKAYASKDALATPYIDPRFSFVTRGTAPNWEDLNGKWAVPGDGYGQSILKIYEDLSAFAKTFTPSPVKTAEEITADNLIADGVAVDRTYWLAVLTGQKQADAAFIKTIFDRYHEKLK